MGHLVCCLAADWCGTCLVLARRWFWEALEWIDGCEAFDSGDGCGTKDLLESCGPGDCRGPRGGTHHSRWCEPPRDRARRGRSAARRCRVQEKQPESGSDTLGKDYKRRGTAHSRVAGKPMKS